MIIEALPLPFTVCKVEDYAALDQTTPFLFLSYTDGERSLVCPTSQVPDNTLAREDGWRAFRVAELLDFTFIGIISHIATVLANNQIPVFVISTFDTDYVWVKAPYFERSLDLMEAEGYTVTR